MRLLQSITEQLREVRELWCKFTGKCEVAPIQDDRIDWLRDQQMQSRQRRRNVIGEAFTGHNRAGGSQ